jgi:glycerol-3-phosphate O-acyltransferase
MTELNAASSPWMNISDNNVVFILDAANRYELKLLNDWLNKTKPDGVGQINTVKVLLTQDKGTVDRGNIVSKLNLPDDAVMAPVRVAWLPVKDINDSSLRFRNLFFGDSRRPGAFRAKQIVRENPERLALVAGAPATLGDLKAGFAQLEHLSGEGELAAYVARRAAVALDMTERRLKGGRYKVPRYVAGNLRASKDFNTGLEELAVEQGVSKDVLMIEARKYMKEMISRPSTFYLDFYAKFNKFVLGLGYEDEVVSDKNDIEKMRTMVRENPALLLWTHKTYLDGMVVPKVLYDNDFPMPHMFGGANLAFAGLGFLLRRSGGIFIRRTFQDNPVYKLTLRHYIGYLMEKRFPMNWAFEGTRSRLGKLMPPRYGLLKYVLEACYETGAENIHIIPIAISYDLIRDVEEYATEQTGRAKSAESLAWFIGYVRSLRKPMGRVYMDVGEPVILAKAPHPDDRLALAKVAFEVAVAANKVTPLTLPSILSMVLLGAAPQALTNQELQAQVKALHDWAVGRGIRISSDFNAENAEHTQKVIDIMIAEGMLTRYDEGPDMVFGIAPEQHPVASYYRNTVVHFFVNKAIIELALVAASDVLAGQAIETFWKEIDRLRNLFKFEFFYAPTDEFHAEIRQEIERCDSNWEVSLTEGTAGFIKLFESLRPLVAQSVLLPYIEAYTVVGDLLARLEPWESLDESTAISTALKYGRQSYLQRRISSEASIGKILFQNAYKLFKHNNLVDGGADDLKDKRKAAAREIRDLSRQLKRLVAVDEASRAL